MPEACTRTRRLRWRRQLPRQRVLKDQASPALAGTGKTQRPWSKAKRGILVYAPVPDHYPQRGANMDTIDCLPSCHQPTDSAYIMEWNCPHVFHEECLRQWPQLEVADHLPKRCPTCEALYVGPPGELTCCEEAGVWTLALCFWAPIAVGIGWLFWDLLYHTDSPV